MEQSRDDSLPRIVEAVASPTVPLLPAPQGLTDAPAPKWKSAKDAGSQESDLEPAELEALDQLFSEWD